MSIRPDDPRLAGLPQEDIDAILRPYYQAEVDAAYASKTAAYGTGSTTVTPVTPVTPVTFVTPDGRGQFTAIERDAIDAAAGAARNYSGDEATAQYIRDLQAGKLGGGADTEAALSRLVEQGELRNLAARGDRNLFPGDNGKGGGGGGGGGGGDNAASFNQDAFDLLKGVFEDLGLTGLETQVRDLVARNITKSDDVLFYLRDTQQYKTRFQANEARKQKSLTQLLPAAYVTMEQGYKSALIANGFDPTLYDEYTDFQNLISGDVSVAELQSRINEGYKQVVDADPEVIRQMQELYNVTPGQLAQYFLDPQKTLSKLKQQANAANIAARAKEQGKLQLTPITAEELVSRGYTEAQAQQAFGLLSEKAGLFSEMTDEEALTGSQKIGAAFGYDVSSQQAIEQRATKRKAVFQGGGSFAKTTGQTSGTVQTGLGVAE